VRTEMDIQELHSSFHLFPGVHGGKKLVPHIVGK
jgi:hypothetical protein